jgi:uncharacterized Zn finger protein
MSWYDYYDARERKAELQLKIEKLRKRGEKFEALAAPAGNKKLATTFWGKAWCDHLEKHKDYEHRLPRGRSYLRQGNVYNLAIEPGAVTAVVAGSELYDVRITMKPLARATWKRLKADCAGQVTSLLDLLGGRLGEGVLRTIADPEHGLFPEPRDIRLVCSCPDAANMCKHVAAVLYGVGVQLDTKPELFFTLRSIDPAELLTTTARDALADAQGADTALAGEDLSALFGIALSAEAPEPAKAPQALKPAKAPKPKKPKGKKRRRKAAARTVEI